MRNGQESNVPAVADIVLVCVVIESVGIVLVNDTGGCKNYFVLKSKKHISKF
jgi:hypothetical protein